MKEIYKKPKKKNFYFKFKKLDISNFKNLKLFFQKNKFDIVVNLAAQAGIRYSIKNPVTTLKSNLIGFFNLIELSKTFKVKHFIYASTSSVYGNNKIKKFKEVSNTDYPIQFYAATKKSNEVIANSYSSAFRMNITGLRFYCLWTLGRPDMAF